MKRKFLMVVAVVLTMCLLASCSPTAGGGSGSSASTDNQSSAATGTADSGEIVWWGWTPGSPVNEQYIEAFNETYPDISVTWKQSTVNDYDAALKPALAQGEGVDAFQVSAGSANGGVAVFGSQALDMEPALIEALGEDYTSKFSEAAIETMTVDGQLKAIGVGTVYAGNLWINLDLFEEYDVAIPTNMEEWKAACQTFEENGIIGFVQGAGQGAFNMDTYHAICDNVNPGLFTKAAQGEVEWTEPDLVRAMELWKSLFDEGIMQDGALGIQQYPEANNLFMSQQAAMIMMGSWYSFNAIPENMKATMEAASSTDEPFTMIPIDFPDIAGTGNVGSLFGDLDYATAVSAKSENAEAATTFAVWLGASEEGQQIIADSLNMVPALKGITPNWDVVELVNPEKQNEVIQEFLGTAADHSTGARFADINADMNQAMMDVLAAVASGTMTPEDACASLAQSQAEFS